MRKRLICFFVLGFVFLIMQVQSQTESTVTDIDGNVYQTVTIGDQVWMVQNLKTTRYNDGTPIPLVSDNTVWSNVSSPGFCWYNNDKKHKETYGALYNGYAIETGKLCPEGWRVATDEDWKKLEIAAGMSEEDAGKAWWRGAEGGKLAGRADLWVKGAVKKEPEFNSSGFTGLPGGNRLGENGLFGNMSSNGYWWCAETDSAGQAWCRNLYYGSTNVIKSIYSKKYGFSVRCVKD